jgi:predicted nucleotidyltransferase
MAPAIPPSLRPALEAYCERLRSVFGARLREVRLFGSFARGEANDTSDVDVLVLVDGLTSLEMLTAVGEATPVLLDTGLPLSPVAMSTERFEELRQRERAFARALDEEGIRM